MRFFVATYPPNASTVALLLDTPATDVDSALFFATTGPPNMAIVAFSLATAQKNVDSVLFFVTTGAPNADIALLQSWKRPLTV